MDLLPSGVPGAGEIRDVRGGGCVAAPPCWLQMARPEDAAWPGTRPRGPLEIPAAGPLAAPLCAAPQPIGRAAVLLPAGCR